MSSISLVQLTITMIELYVFVLAGFVGYQVITQVPPLLHTPLLSATNAISGISLVGALVDRRRPRRRSSTILGFVAVTAATINVVGGFLITDRMLKMFSPKKKSAIRAARWHAGHAQTPSPATDARTGRRLTDGSHDLHRVDVSRRVGAVHPRPAQPHPPRQGAPRHAAGVPGMLLAIIGTLINHDIVDYHWIVVGLVVGALIGYPMALVPMTAMPQRIASRTCSARWPRRSSASPSTTARPAASSTGHDGGAGLRGAVRRADHHRQLHGLRQAAGIVIDRRPITFSGQNASTSRCSPSTLAIVRVPGRRRRRTSRCST